MLKMIILRVEHFQVRLSGMLLKKVSKILSKDLKMLSLVTDAIYSFINMSLYRSAVIPTGSTEPSDNELYFFNLDKNYKISDISFLIEKIDELREHQKRARI